MIPGAFGAVGITVGKPRASGDDPDDAIKCMTEEE